MNEWDNVPQTAAGLILASCWLEPQSQCGTAYAHSCSLTATKSCTRCLLLTCTIARVGVALVKRSLDLSSQKEVVVLKSCISFSYLLSQTYLQLSALSDSTLSSNCRAITKTSSDMISLSFSSTSGVLRPPKISACKLKHHY